MAEERREEWQGQQPQGQQPVAEAPQPTPEAPAPRRGGGFAGFVLGLIIGALAVGVIAWFWLKIPLEHKTQELEMVNDQLQATQARLQKMSQEWARMKEVYDAVSKVLAEGAAPEAAPAQPTPPMEKGAPPTQPAQPAQPTQEGAPQAAPAQPPQPTQPPAPEQGAAPSGEAAPQTQ